MSIGNVFFCDSFEKWTTKDDCFGKWNAIRNATTVTTFARTGSRSLEMGYGSHPKAIKGLPNSYGKFCVGAGIRLAPSDDQASLNQVIYELTNWEATNYNGLSSHTSIRLKVNQDWGLILETGYDYGSVSFEVTTNTYPIEGLFISPHQWYHLALSIEAAYYASGGSYYINYQSKVYVNEKEYNVPSSVKTFLDSTVLSMVEERIFPRSLMLGGCLVGQRSSIPAQYTYVDDLYISSDYEGDLEIDVIDPIGNSTIGWTPSTGTNWEAVNKEIHAETPYISKNYDESPLEDSYEMEDVGDVDEIVAIQGVLMGSKENGARGIVTPVYNGSAGDEAYLSKGSLIFTDVKEQNPATSAAWTPTEVDALIFGAIDAY